MKGFIQFLQVLTYRYTANLTSLRASALTFNTALSVVPVIAVMLGIAKGFGIEGILEAQLATEFQDQQEVIQKLIQFSYNLLEQARHGSGIVAGVGVLILFYTVLRLLETVEDSLNNMWGVLRGRSLSRKIIDFIALIVIAPIFLVISSSLTVFVSTYLETIKDTHVVFTQLQPYLLKVLSIVPYVINTVLFTSLYIYMPNTKVSYKAAVVAGGLAGIAFQILQASYITLQIKLTQVGTIYGSFAALPLFLMWLYFSWMIFLLGAEIMVIYQEKLWNSSLQAILRPLSIKEKELLAIAVMKASVDKYLHEQKPIMVDDLVHTYMMAKEHVVEAVQTLCKGGLLVQVGEGLIPGRVPEQVSVFDVVNQMDGTVALKGAAFTQLESVMQTFTKPLEEAEKSSKLCEI